MCTKLHQGIPLDPCEEIFIVGSQPLGIVIESPVHWIFNLFMETIHFTTFVDAETMVRKGEVEFFKKKGKAEFYVPPEEEPPEEPSKLMLSHELFSSNALVD